MNPRPFVEPATPEQHRIMDAWDAGWQARAEQAHADCIDAYDRGWRDATGTPEGLGLGVVILIAAFFIIGVVLGAVLS